MGGGRRGDLERTGCQPHILAGHSQQQLLDLLDDVLVSEREDPGHMWLLATVLLVSCSPDGCVEASSAGHPSPILVASTSTQTHVETGLLGEMDAFREALDEAGDADLVDHFGQLAVTGRPHQPDHAGKSLYDGFGLGKGGFIAAAHDCENAVDGTGFAA